MKNLRAFITRHAVIISSVSCFLMTTSCMTSPDYSASGRIQSQNIYEVANVAPGAEGKKAIRIALLLDTSNSMDGLIDQAKSTLWKFVNALSATTYDGEIPKLEIALYEYGNDGLSSEGNFIRQVSAFTSELDHVSEMLYSLKTNGGSEYCGAVIQKSVEELLWQGNMEDLRLIFIAGNEPFNQGGINFEGACSKAKERSIIVNTIFCGDFEGGIQTSWKKGADIADGSYMSIEQDRQTVFIETPYDGQIDILNTKLNATYIYYGADGATKWANQSIQDQNASAYGSANKIERSVSKANSFYSNYSWDLVDACNQKGFDIGVVKASELPVELRSKSEAELLEYIAVLNTERELVKKQINEINAIRNEYIAANKKGPDNASSLDNAMLTAIKNQAIKKGFVVQ